MEKEQLKAQLTATLMAGLLAANPENNEDAFADAVYWANRIIETTHKGKNDNGKHIFHGGYDETKAD